MTTIRVDAYPGSLDSVEVREVDSPYTLLETIAAAGITEVVGGVYEVVITETTGNWMLVLLDVAGDTLGVKYASPSYSQASDRPLWITEVDFTEIKGAGFDSNTDTLEKIRDAISSEGGSSGSETVIITIKNTDAEPIANATVYITSDITGSTIVVDDLITNAEGQVSVRLDPGTYYVWSSKDNVAFSNPTSITVVDV